MSENNAHSVTNPQLKENLQQLRLKQSPELEETIYDEICNHASFLSVIQSAPDSTVDVPKFDIPVMTSAGHGYLFYPVFTDMEELRKWNKDENAQIAVLRFDNYAEMVAEHENIHGLVIDPFGVNFPIERDMVDYLQVQRTFFGKLAIEQMFHEEHSEGPTVSAPDPYPAAMEAAMQEYMATNPLICRAWLRRMKNEDEESYLVVVEADNGDEFYDFDEISGAAMPHLDGMYLDFMNLGDEFSRRAVEGVEPFYTRA
mgnify:CR=1 FL=1